MIFVVVVVFLSNNVFAQTLHSEVLRVVKPTSGLK